MGMGYQEARERPATAGGPGLPWDQVLAFPYTAGSLDLGCRKVPCKYTALVPLTMGKLLFDIGLSIKKYKFSLQQCGTVKVYS